MKKLFIFLCIIFLYTLTGCSTIKNYENTEFTKLSLNNNEGNNTIIEKEEVTQPIETEINSYSSPVLDKSEGRINNLIIGCSYINRLYCSSSVLHFLLMK